MDKISVLEKKASALREGEKKRAIAEIRKLIELHDVQPAELFSVAGSSVIVKPASKPLGRPAGKTASVGGKKVLSPKYRDPATGKTWNGHGKKPFWLPIGNRDAYLIAGQAVAASSTGNASHTTGAAKRGKLKAKSSLQPKYRDPATGKTWNGHGKKPFWLPIGNRDAYLIAGQAGAVKPKQTAKSELSAALKSSAAKLAIAAPKSGKSARPVVKSKASGKTEAPKAGVSGSDAIYKPLTAQTN
ncbi:MAG: H-NS histone family protein [Candidatus Accumulibacter sp.]|jgi:DNA-binding protein H-NS|nr:H-NS histone family protein [Accumulibacter sp.]